MSARQHPVTVHSARVVVPMTAPWEVTCLPETVPSPKVGSSEAELSIV